MSNLLKSKFFLGVMIVAVMVVGGVVANVSNNTASADCSITTTLRLGSKGTQVVCLQQSLGGLTADGNFGPMTKAAVVKFQKNSGLTADGIFGAKSRAVWMSNAGNSASFPAGCASASGYSTTTGLACYAIPSSNSFPAGCTSNLGFSPTTGASCATGVSTTYPAGCTSASGFSPTTGASCATGAVNNQTGPVSVSLSSDNPASGYIIANQATADLAHFTFTGTGTINTVVLQRTGISDQNTLSNVYLFNGNVRLTDGFSFNNVGQLTMNSLGIAINGPTTISVKADVASVTNASSLGITLIGFTAAGQSATTVSVKGNEMTYGTGNLASVYLNGTSQTVTGTPTVNAGTSAYTVWSNPLQVNTRAVWLKGANFRLTGSAPADALGNIRLYVDGVAVGSAATMGTITGSNYAMFDFSSVPVSLSTGSHTVDVRADIVKGASYTVTVSLQQASDLVLYDGQVGVNVAVTKTSALAYVASTSGVITINAGTASVVVDPTFSAQTNITGGATNVVIGKYKVHGYGEDVKVSSLSVTPILTSACTSGATYGSSTCNVTTSGATHTQFANGNGLNNVTLFFNGSQVGSSTGWVSGSGAISFNLGSQMILPAGVDSYIEVRADLTTDSGGTYAAGGPDPLATTGVNYTAGTVSADLTYVAGNAQGQTSHTAVDFPSSSKTGTTMTIQTGTLAVSKNTGYASQSIGPNTAGVKIGSYILQNQSTSESVRVTSLALTMLDVTASTTMTSSTTPALTNFSNLRTSETSGSGANPVQPSGSNTFSVDFTIAPSATKVIDVFADTSSTVSTSFSTKLVVTSLGSSSNVSISQNGTGTAVNGQVMTLAVGTVDNTTNLISLLSAPSTAQQFVPSANGATNATKATFKINATGGSVNISEMKFRVNSADVSQTLTSGTTTVGKQTDLLVSDGTQFLAGDVVQLANATNSTYGVGTVVSISTNTLTVNISVAPTTAATLVRLVPATVTSVTVNGISAAPVNGVVYLTGLNLTVPNGGAGLSQDAYVSYASVGTNGIMSGATSRVALEYMKYTSGNTTTEICSANIKTCSQAILTANIPYAPTMKLVGSAPSLVLASSGSTLTTGSVDVGHITVTAKGDITLNSLPINVILTHGTGTTTLSNAVPGYQANGIVVKDGSGNPVTTTNTAFGSTTAGGTSTISFTGGYTIPAGTSQTFKIFLQFDTVDSTNHAGTATLSMGTADLLSWTDTAGNAATTTGADLVGSAATLTSNKWIVTTNFTSSTTVPATEGTGSGFLYNYPTTTVGVSS